MSAASALACHNLARTVAIRAPAQKACKKPTRDAGAREDLFQEIALALWTALPCFRGESSERTWLYRVAHNTAARFLVKRTRYSRHELPGGVEEEPVSPVDPEKRAIDDQRRERLWAGVQRLPLLDRQLVVMHLEGLSAAEIEAITGLSAGNVATRLTRARQKLAANIRGEEER